MSELSSTPEYIPKVPSAAGQTVIPQVFFPPPHEMPEQESLHLVCPVRALRIYVHRSGLSVLVCIGGRNRGNTVNKEYILHGITDAITLYFEACGMVSSLVVRAHSTRSVVSSKALARGAPIHDACGRMVLSV